MRKIAPFLVMLTVAACGPPMRWEKPGMDPETLARDQAYCLAAAQREAANMYPFSLPPPVYAGYSSSAYLYWQQQNDANRFYAQNSLARFCMRNKGYELVPIPQPAAPAKSTDK